MKKAEFSRYSFHSPKSAAESRAFMPLSVILAKIVGLILFGFTVRSIFRHVKEVKSPEYKNKQADQSVSEQLLNNALLYVWLFFCVVFSLGMVVNN